MCLEEVSKVRPKSEGFGYKLVYPDGNRFRSEYAHPTAGPRSLSEYEFYDLGEWYHKGPSMKLPMAATSAVAWGLPRYKNGFHIFPSLETARAYVTVHGYGSARIVRVEYAEAHTKGLQWTGTKMSLVVVADYMRIVDVLPHSADH